MYSQRQYEARSKGKFHSKNIPLRARDRKQALRFAHRGIAVIFNNLMKDDLKYATNYPSAPVKSAYFTQASTNVYMGANLNKSEDNEEVIVLRTAYGTGTGATSIGLNPATVRNNPIPPPIWGLVEICTRAASVRNEEWARTLETYPINNVTGKFYYSYLNKDGKPEEKNTGPHVDVTRNKRNVPLRNNSQEPDSLVMMYCFGDAKELWFKKHLDRTTIVPNSEIRIEQTHGTLFILDHRDEMWNEQEDGSLAVYRHSSNMINSEGMTFMLIMRCVAASQEVHPAGELVNPQTTELRQNKFKEAEDLMNSEWYRQRLNELEGRKRNFLLRFKPN
jgi:hypothetical protein